ncbi:hypothetical protein CONPUDRAFT_75392 [Coniophora puteana RWD-64-598 SS2]|uniref:Uncharacterized protein n=1 Tax=Coniophora puteana (strain RWD-64-598) TaxID=741705 RepID=A0A5M3ME28_CONPW|nr:uncharacterized protein CONPUDRAFT_75392 [Coniophora puteana RWD-64-598 SS2]EIW77529.1 hypothetical protein CONPUDRAFT_75392 [Coniophora puteana RWD-64-598 SS2]
MGKPNLRDRKCQTQGMKLSSSTVATTVPPWTAMTLGHRHSRLHRSMLFILSINHPPESSNISNKISAMSVSAVAPLNAENICQYFLSVKGVDPDLKSKAIAMPIARIICSKMQTVSEMVGVYAVIDDSPFGEAARIFGPVNRAGSMKLRLACSSPPLSPTDIDTGPAKLVDPPSLVLAVCHPFQLPI